MDVQRSLSDIYNMCDLAHDTRSHLGAQEALQRAQGPRFDVKTLLSLQPQLLEHQIRC